MPLADLCWVRGTRFPPWGSKPCGFWKNLTKSYVGAYLEGWTPSYRESWIHHWVSPEICVRRPTTLIQGLDIDYSTIFHCETVFHIPYIFFSSSAEDSPEGEGRQPQKWGQEPIISAKCFEKRNWTQSNGGSTKENFGRAALGVQILSISCSFWKKFGKIVCWCPHIGEILDPPLERVDVPNALLRSTNVGYWLR